MFWRKLCRFPLEDLIIIPFVGLVGLILSMAIISKCLMTLTPSPLLMTVIENTIKVSCTLKEYGTFTYCLWRLPEYSFNEISSIS